MAAFRTLFTLRVTRFVTPRTSAAMRNIRTLSFAGNRRPDPDFRTPRRGFDPESFGVRLGPKDWTGEAAVVLPEPMELPLPTMTEVEIQDFRMENRISLLGHAHSAPPPVTDFSVFPDHIVEVLAKKFEAPMPVQAQGWPIALGGLDLIAIGQTGSGKTLGYLLPAIMHVSRKPLRGPYDGPSGLVLAPTRELAQQIEKVLYSYLRNTPQRLRSACLFGGSSKGQQMRKLRDGVDIVIATPGRLIDLLEMEVLNLDNTTYLVLDEADRMLDMGFEPQIRKVMGQIRPERQLSMWSATWPNEVRNLAEDFLSGASEEKRGQYIHLNIGSVDLQANKDITQHVHLMKPFDKQTRLLALVRDIKNETKERVRVLIFAETKRSVDFLDRILLREGHRVESIHGDKTQNQRNRSLDQFRRGRCDILVATDVASRGLDVDDIQHVINYDFPNTTEDYIHRIGRTGRRGKSGTSHTFFTEDDAGMAKDLVKVLREANQDVPDDLEALAQTRAMLGKKKFNRYNREGGMKRYNRDFVRTSYDLRK